MAPGIDGLPAAERDVDVSGPVAQFLTSVSPRLLIRLRLGLRAFEWLPFPRRFSRLDPGGARRRSCHRLEGSRLSLQPRPAADGEAVLDPRLRGHPGGAGADRLRDRLRPRRRDRCPSRPAPSATPSRSGERRGMRRRHRRLRCRRRRRRGDAGRGRARRAGARGRRPLRPRQLPERPPRGDRQPLPRRRPDDRRRAAADPGAGGEGRRRHHRDQLRHLLPRSRPGARGLEAALRHRLGRRPRRRLRRGRGASSASPSSTPSGWAATASWRWRAPPRSAPAAAPISRNAGSCVQCSSCPFGCEIDAKRGMHVSYLPRAVAAGARIRAGVEAGRRDRRGRPRRRRRVPGPRRVGPFTVRAKRAVIVAGGALGTPELLQRSGLGRAPGRPQPPHPPRLLGRRPLRGGGARLGRA